MVEVATCLPQLLERRSVRRLGWPSVSERVLEGVRHQLRELRVVHQELPLGLAGKGLAGCTVALGGLLAGEGLAASVATSEELLAGVRPHRLTDPELRVGLAGKDLAGCLEGVPAGRGLAGCVATCEELLAGVRPHRLPEELWGPLLLLRDGCDTAGELVEDFRGLLLLLGELGLAEELLMDLEEGLLDEKPMLPEAFWELLNWVLEGKLLEDFEELQLEDGSQLMQCSYCRG